MKTKLFVDDLRMPPDDSWDIARTFHDAIHFLDTRTYSVVSLDHDIASFYGTKEMTGRDILNWLIERKLVLMLWTPPEVRVHSANIVGCATMEADIKRYFNGD